MYLKSFFPNESVNQKRIEASQKSMDIYTALIGFSITPAIIEEICFRGILFIIILGSSSYFFNLTEHRNDWIGLTVFFIFSSLFFGFAHVVQGYDIQNAGGYIVSGVVFSFIFLWTRNLKLPVIIHGLNNTFSILYRYDLQYVNVIIYYSLLLLCMCFMSIQFKKIQDYGAYIEYRVKKKYYGLKIKE
ncbi:CPBP family intramembrane glutamic endopeptidase [Staphylococcus aureus]|uniref:CPBP family intramembrane glutamic endopeptidase n=1 Tax=Staphylococcus aureus TaxID=1280 RepID=UPI0027F88D29|nr:CPBP family intramembrane glutamic endopeptidase [Staphylococcus aureus]MDQ7134602.1 CPBP family intramembrane glutamic endopeptidase [Staphylococcus aureus]